MVELSTHAGRRPLRLTLAVLVAAAAVTLGLLVQLQPSGLGAFAAATAWLIVPHADMAWLLIALSRRGRAMRPWCLAAVVVAALGLGVLVDAMYLHPDPQSAIAVVLAPVVQGVVFLLAAPLAGWASRRSLPATGSG